MKNSFVRELISGTEEMYSKVRYETAFFYNLKDINVSTSIFFYI